MSLVGSLDLNDLHALGRTAHGIRMSLLSFRLQIISRTLRCVHEDDSQRRAATGPWAVPCARDLVAPCRRCGTTVCRNCTIKPPSNRELPQRHRRLCRACQKSPIHSVTSVPKALGQASARPGEAEATTARVAAFGRGPCTCQSDGVFVCRNCHTSQASADVTYTRVWTWRSRYHSLGFGLGTGIGEGNEGVKCGRGERCLAARDIIVDMDCAEDGMSAAVLVDDWGEEVTELRSPSRGDAHHEGHGDADHHRGGTAGYYRQEIEGIGGVVKKKLKKRVRVGATVTEYEDEREKGGYLDRERSGKTRSWCAWCDRVIPSGKDGESLRRSGVEA